MDWRRSTTHGIGGDFHAAAMIVFFDRVHEPHVAFLDQIQSCERAVARVLFAGQLPPPTADAPSPSLHARVSAHDAPAQLGGRGTHARNGQADALCDRKQLAMNCLELLGALLRKGAPC